MRPVVERAGGRGRGQSRQGKGGRGRATKLAKRGTKAAPNVGSVCVATKATKRHRLALSR